MTPNLSFDALSKLHDPYKSAKEEVRQAELELEKLDLKKCIHSLESKSEEQFVQVLEMSRIITELQEDLEKAKITWDYHQKIFEGHKRS